jgi:hypothetical protein
MPVPGLFPQSRLRLAIAPAPKSEPIRPVARMPGSHRVVFQVYPVAQAFRRNQC